MKKRILIPILALALTLTGCASGFVGHPDTMADGTAWDDSWVNMGGRIGVEQPGNGFQLLTTNGTLENLDIQYATWVRGEETEIDKDTYVYDEQIYLMTEACESAEAAAEAMDGWFGQLNAAVSVTGEERVELGGASFTVFPYECTAADSHFDRGVFAVWTHGDMVLTVDIACAAGIDTDLVALMESFLRGIHYA